MRILGCTLATQGQYNVGTNSDKNEEKVPILERLYEEPSLILKIKEPTEEQKEVALKEMPSLITQLIAPIEADYLVAVRTDGSILKDLKAPSKKVIMEALSQCGSAIKYVENPNNDQIKVAIISDPSCIKYLKAPTEDQLELAVRQDGLAIQFIDNPTENLQLKAIKQNPVAISLISSPTSKAKQLAISLDGLVIEHIKNPEESIQLQAVENSVLGYAYRYIDSPTPAVDIAAYRKNNKLLPYLKSVPEEIQLEIIGSNIDNFVYIKKPSKKVQKQALKFIVSNPHLFDDVSNIDADVLADFLTEISFKEKHDKRLLIPKGLNLQQLRLYRWFQINNKKEMLKSDLRKQDWAKDDKRIAKIIDSVKGPNIDLQAVLDYKIWKPESELGTFIQRKYGIAKIENEHEKEVFETTSSYFVVYVDAIKLLDLEFNKDHIVNMSTALADRQQPYIPNQYILGYVRYTCMKQNVWIDDIWRCPVLKSQDEDLKWLTPWIMSLFIREMRYRDYNKFYCADKSLRSRLYKDSTDFSSLLKYCYFKLAILKGFHPLVNGKDVFVLD